MSRTVAAILLAFSTALPLQALTIYGKDDRVDVGAAQDPRAREAARGVAVMINSANVTLSGSTAVLKSTKLGIKRSLRRGARFYDQPSAGYCTVSLVAPDVVLTAGHCLDEIDYCANTSFAFDYVAVPGRNAAEVPASSVYKCAALLGREYFDADPKKGTPGADWALMRLDRAAEGRPLLQFASGVPAAKTPLLVLGFPNGLPMKAATGFARGEDPDKTVFRAEVDTFHGNSGSPVYNAVTLEVVGILVDGDEDYVSPIQVVDVVTAFKWLRPSNRSVKLYKLPAGGGDGEGVERLDIFHGKMKALLAAPSFDGSR